MGVSISGLHTKPGGKATYRVMRYSIQMQMRDVGTRYRIKAWSLNKRNPKTATEIFSNPLRCESSFDHREISQSLSESFALGDGIENRASFRTGQPSHSTPMHHPNQEIQDTSSYSHLSSGETHEQQRVLVREPLPPDVPRGASPGQSVATPRLRSQLEKRQAGAEMERFAVELPAFADDAMAVMRGSKRKRTARTQGSQFLDPATPLQSPLREVRTRQRQSTDSTVEFNEGDPRPKGGKFPTPCSGFCYLLVLMFRKAVGHVFSDIMLARKARQAARNVWTLV